MTNSETQIAALEIAYVELAKMLGTSLDFPVNQLAAALKAHSREPKTAEVRAALNALAGKLIA